MNVNLSTQNIQKTSQNLVDTFNIKTRNKLTAFFIKNITLIIHFLTFGKIKKTRYIKLINEKGHIKYVATKHLVDAIFKEEISNDFNGIRHDAKIQKLVTKLFDPFKSGIINHSCLHKALHEHSKIEWIKNVEHAKSDISKSTKESAKLALDKLKEIHATNKKNKVKEFPLSWKDFLSLEPKVKEKFKAKFEEVYGNTFTTALMNASSKDQLSPTMVDALEDIFNKKMDSFEENLHHGDLIFYKLDTSKFSISSLFKKDERIDYTILQGQKIAKNWSTGPLENESFSFIHVGVIAKQPGKKTLIVEAAPGSHGDDIRSVNLRDIAGRLGPTSKQSYRITRMLDPELTDHFTNLAFQSSNHVDYDDNCIPKKIHPLNTPLSTIKDEVLKATNLRYSKTGASKSIFSNTRMNKANKANLFEAYAYELKDKNSFIKNGKSRSLYCSYFISFSIQYAEASKIINKIIKENNYQFDFSKMSAKEIRKWARAMEKSHGQEFKNLTIQYNPENMSPQKFRTIIHKNAHKFVDVLSILPPSA